MVIGYIPEAINGGPYHLRPPPTPSLRAGLSAPLCHHGGRDALRSASHRRRRQRWAPLPSHAPADLPSASHRKVFCFGVFFPPRGDIVPWKRIWHPFSTEPTKVLSWGVPVTHELTVDAWKDVPMEGASAPDTPPVPLVSACVCPHTCPFC